MKKLIRLATIPLSLNVLLKGQLRFLSQYFSVTAISGKGSDFDEVRDREKVATWVVNMERKISPIKDIISLLKLYRYFRAEKPQIIHSITPKAGLLSMVAGKLAGVPVRMHTFTGLIFPSKTGRMQKLLIFMDKLLCYCATNIYPEGLGVKNDLINYKITSKTLSVLANGNVNGIDTSYFNSANFSANETNSFKATVGIPENDFVFVFVGRLVSDKGINELVSAFKQLKMDHCKLLLVGPYEQELDALTPSTLKEIEDNLNIITVGYQQDVRLYFAISDALVFPSYREGFPNVVMQAGSMGLPGIVSDINGCNEIIIDGENGLIIPVRDIGALQRSMRKLLEDKDLKLLLQGNSRPMIVSRYEQQLVWDAILAEYKKLGNNV